MMDKALDFFSELESSAKAAGAQAELILSESESFSASFNKGEMNKYSFDQSLSAAVRVIYGKGAGFSSTEKLTRESIFETFQEALRSAQDLHREAQNRTEAQALYRPLFAPEKMDLYHPDIERIDISEKLDKARRLESAAMEFDSRVQNIPYSRYAESKGRKALISTAGVQLNQQAGGITAFTYALSRQANDSKSGDYSKFVRHPQQLNVDQIAHEAARRSVHLLGAVQPPSGHYPVVFLNEVAADLIAYLNHHLSAKTLDEGTSLLSGKKGQKLFSDQITIIDDPFLTDLSGARPFDSEGAPSQRSMLIENGVLKSYLTNSHLAEKLNLPHTANAARSGGEMDVAASNTLVSAGQASVEDLLKSHRKVVFITSVDAINSGFKASTLDFSLPAYGFLYENGEAVQPLHQMVVSGNLLQLLKNIEGMSHRHNQEGSSVMAPDILIPEMSIAGC